MSNMCVRTQLINVKFLYAFSIILLKYVMPLLPLWVRIGAIYIIGVEIGGKELSFSSFLFVVSYFSITFA